MSVSIANEQEALPLSADRLRREAEEVAKRAGFGGELSVAIVTDEAIRKLNREFLEHDYATDVLAFPIDEEEGEVVVSAERALEEAAERGVDPLSELMLYVTHGILHLAGWDDGEPEEARRMHEEALGLLEALGYENR
ncbi:MAG: rRNA maturation RNase YbeY [Planctomycetota bacterium]